MKWIRPAFWAAVIIGMAISAWPASRTPSRSSKQPPAEANTVSPVDRPTDREPVVEGVTIREWARRLRSSQDKNRAAAETAIRRLGQAAAPALKAMLNEGDVYDRQAAAEALGCLGPDAADAAPALIAALNDVVTNREASEALPKIGPAALPLLIRTLEEALRERRLFLVGEVAFTLGHFGSQARDAIPLLAAGLKEPEIRSEVAGALARIGVVAAPALTAALKDPDPRVRSDAARALTTLAPSRLDAWQTLLADGDEHDRFLAAEGLGKLGPAAAPAAPALVAGLKADSWRHAAQKALVRIGPAAVPSLAAALNDEELQNYVRVTLHEIGRPAVPTLVAILRDGNLGQRKGVAAVLNGLGSDAEDAVAVLAATAADPDPSLREAAIRALGAIAGRADAAVPVLVTALDGNTLSVRRLAAAALGKYTPQHERARQRLLAALADPDLEVRNFAAFGLSRAGKTVIPGVVDVLHAGRRPAVDAAAEALRYLGPQGVPPLMAALRANPKETRIASAFAIQVMGMLRQLDGATASEASGLLGELLRDKDPELQDTAWPALGAMRMPAIPVLVAAMKDRRPNVRLNSVVGLGRVAWHARHVRATDGFAMLDAFEIAAYKNSRLVNLEDLENLKAANQEVKAASREVVPVLVPALIDENPVVRRGAASALEVYGTHTAAAIPALRAAGVDKDPTVRAAAQKALQAIDR